MRREVNSYHPKPKNLIDFPLINVEAVKKLAGLGIKTTLHLYEKVLNPGMRKKLASETGINIEIIRELTGLTDIVRIKWVGLIFARMIYDAGYDCVEKVSLANPEDFYKKLIALNEEKQYTKSKFALHDIRLCVKVAGQVPLDIEY